MANLQTKTNELLAFALSAIFLALMVSNYFGQQAASITYNVLNMSITGSLVFFSIIQIFRNNYSSQLGKAWICFSSFAVLWFIAEAIWLVDELVYHVKPWPSEADYFWFAGYPLYFMFSAYYLKPFKTLVSKKIVFLASATTVTVLVFSISVSGLQDIDLSKPEAIIGLAYPIADAVSLFPITVSLSLFFRGQVSFLWLLLMMGMLCFVVSDLGFLIFTLDDSYYSGHPIDTIYLWAYTFLLFGSYSQLHIFKKRNSENMFNKQDSLR
ncbi:MAG: hypothetical protein EPO62_07470 [Candidatus Nitrosotenuis sp.]|nr:MAG: hypothetical protein EPO62_07470 [Candidatus Nitrosotenuis sp.]